jgi:hypothetical protein
VQQVADNQPSSGGATSLVTDASHPSNVKVSAGTLYAWNVTAGLAAGHTSCVGWQIDGPGVTENFETYSWPASVLDSRIPFAQ